RREGTQQDAVVQLEEDGRYAAEGAGREGEQADERVMDEQRRAEQGVPADWRRGGGEEVGPRLRGVDEGVDAVRAVAHREGEKRVQRTLVSCPERPANQEPGGEQRPGEHLHAPGTGDRVGEAPGERAPQRRMLRRGDIE